MSQTETSEVKKKRFDINEEVLVFVRDYQADAAKRGQLRLNQNEAIFDLCKLGHEKLKEMRGA